MRILEGMGADVAYIGTTVGGRMIPCAHIGSYCGRQIVIQGAIHAREHITALLVVKQIYYTLERYLNTLEGGIFFAPNMNPDGSELCQFGLESVENAETRKFLLRINGANGTDFTYWKANLNAVDLNTNFAARWGTGQYNVRAPSPSDYIGPYPVSEPETQALVRLTNDLRPALTISYHARGEEIYWEFFQNVSRAVRDRAVGAELAQATGYALIDGDLSSAGGYKDWCIQDFRIPAYTIETVNNRYGYPIDYAVIGEIFEQNKDIPKLALDLANGVIYI